MTTLYLAMDKSYFITWKEFPSHLGRTCKQVLNEGNFADVTLVNDDHAQVKAHRLILSAGSQVF